MAVQTMETPVRQAQELHEQILSCTQCPLHSTRTHAVPGEGHFEAKVMFVGEAPGEQEDLQGKPFVGQAGQLLNHWLADIGLSRREVFIANVLKCRPPQNRDPHPSEVETCTPYLSAQISLIQPEIICPLGRHAMELLLGKEFKISEAHGKIFTRNGTYYLPMYHPAAILRRNNETMKQIVRNDMLRLKALLLKIKKKGEKA